MQGFLNRINKTIEVLWDDYSRKYPGFFYKDQDGRRNMPKIIAAQTMLNLPDFPLYAKRYVDQDPTSWYFMMNASPLAGAADRDTAVSLFYDIFINQLGMHSSYEQEGYDTATAVDMEVLPAATDKNYKTYYDQQMEELAKAMGGGAPDEDAKKRADDEFERKHGFRRDDPDIIDVEVVDPDAPKAQQQPGLQKAKTFAVGGLKLIWYAADLHIPANYELGYNGSGGSRLSGRGSSRRLGGPNGGIRRLREEDLDAMVKEAVLSEGIGRQMGDWLERFQALLDITPKNTKLYTALKDIESMFHAGMYECDACGDPECKDGEICGLKEDDGQKNEMFAKLKADALAFLKKEGKAGLNKLLDGIKKKYCKEDEEALNEGWFDAPLSQEDQDEIAGIFSGYSSGSLSGAERRKVDIFMTAHAAELQRLRQSQASGLGDFGAARDLGNDDEQYESEELDEAYLSQDDKDEIADMFANYSSGNAAVRDWMLSHAAELRALRRGQANGLGDFNAARDLGNDDEIPDEQYESEADIEKEIAGIVNESEENGDEQSETEKLIREYGAVEDDVEEDEDELSESVIRHANMLAREIW